MMGAFLGGAVIAATVFGGAMSFPDDKPQGLACFAFAFVILVVLLRFAP